MIPIKCLIVDDEKPCIRTLSRHIMTTPGLELIASETNPALTFNKIANGILKPDLIFLDMEMPLMSGTEFATMLDGRFPLIFTTAHLRYVEKSYEYNAIYYLLKPIGYQQFLKAVVKAKGIIAESRKSGRHLDGEYFYIKKDGDRLRVMYNDVINIVSDGSYLWLYLIDSKHYIYGTLKHLSETLNPEHFMQVNRSCIVSLSKVIEIKGNVIILSNKTEIKLGDTYRKEFIDRIDRIILNP